MNRIGMRFTVVAVFLGVSLMVFATQARADNGCACWNFPGCGTYGETYGGDLFYDFYSQGWCDRTAHMYPSPGPTPPIAGRTYVTYQPLMPHEFMYKHHRSYHMYYDHGKGLNRTTVHYGYNPVTVGVKRLAHALSFPR